jgi:hypothetical protein
LERAEGKCVVVATIAMKRVRGMRLVNHREDRTQNRLKRNASFLAC